MLTAKSAFAKCPACCAARFYSTPPSQPPARSIIFDSPVYNPDPFPGYLGQSRTRPIRKHRKDLERAKETGSKPSKSVDPWERMKSSPPRFCIVNRKVFPSSFLIRMLPAVIPATTDGPESIQLLPLNVAAPGSIKKGKSMYVANNKESIVTLATGKGPHIGVLKTYPRLKIPANFIDIVRAQLGYRILWELKEMKHRLQDIPVPEESLNPPLGCGDRRIFEWLSADEVEAARQKQAPLSENIVALLDLSSLEPPSSLISEEELQHPPLPTLPPRSDPSISILTSGPHGKEGSFVPFYDVGSIVSPSLHAHLYTLIFSIYNLERALYPSQMSESAKNKSGVLAMSVYHPVNETQKGKNHSEVDGGLATLLGGALWRVACFDGIGWKE